MDSYDLLWFDVISDNYLSVASGQEPERQESNVDPFLVQIKLLKILDCGVCVADVQ